MSQPNVYNEDHIIECNRSKTDTAIYEDNDTIHKPINMPTIHNKQTLSH